MTAVTVSDRTTIRAQIEKGALVYPYTAAEDVDRGEVVSLDSSAEATLADRNSTAAVARGIGIVVDGPFDQSSYTYADGARIGVCVFGPVTGFSSLTPGMWYYLSQTAGALDTAAPAESSNEYKRAVGYALDTTTIFVLPIPGDAEYKS
ncbi:MAG: hypothetical protein WC683_14110 [bacterium]